MPKLALLRADFADLWSKQVSIVFIKENNKFSSKFMKNTCDQAINGFVGVFLQRLIQKAAAFSTYVLAEKNEF